MIVAIVAGLLLLILAVFIVFLFYQDTQEEDLRERIQEAVRPFTDNNDASPN